MILNFKKQVAQDIERVLFNTQEAAELMLVNGVEVPVVVDDEKLEELKSAAGYADGIGSAEKLLFIQLKHFGYRPGIGEFVTLGDDTFRVISVGGSDVLQLVLGASE